MITSLELRDFKNFIDETLCVGPFTVIVGANASGKSNIRDAFRFLHGVGLGYTLADIIGGRYGAGGQVEWDPIRGAASELVAFGKERFSLSVKLTLGKKRTARYEITVGPDRKDNGAFRVWREALRVGWQDIYTTHPPLPDPVRFQNDETLLLLRMKKTGTQKKYGHRVGVRPNQPALTQLHDFRHVRRSHKDYAKRVSNLLRHCRFLDPKPDLMRKPAFPGHIVLGNNGENLATVLREICTDQGRRDVLSDWLRELTPMDVVDFEFPSDPITGRIQLAIREKSARIISAYSASDGTLRFLAMLAALLDRDRASLYVFEEIDNGIHPARLHLLADLIERQTAKGAVQVVTTTHSPELLSIVNDETFENTSVVCRVEDTNDAIIRSVASLPNARVLRESQGLGRLLTAGWMETVLAFGGAGGDKSEAIQRGSSSSRKTFATITSS